MAGKSRMFWIVLVTAFATLVIVVIGMNFVPPEKKIEREIRHRYGVESEQFRREMSLMLGPPIIDGNRITALQNGDEIFPAMLEAIAAAQKTICFETYIYWEGRIGGRFSEALIERARAGVKVHVLIDWAGSQKMDPGMLERMEAAGVEVRRFHPLRWYTLSRMNNRTHRKLLVVDGRVGFTGGVGIADEWLGHAQDPEHWRDVHFRVEGPVVAQIQSVFNDNWITTTGKVLHGPEYFPPLPAAGEQSAQMFSSSPDGGSDSMQLMYLFAIASARRSVDIAAAYLVPDALTRRVMFDALERGVELRIIVPGRHTDQILVRHASRRDWGPLLAAGAQIHEFQPTMFHNKVMIVDGYLVAVGSTNFDNRSFRLNDEANLNVYDRAFARHMTQVFEADLARTRRITFEEWSNRGWAAKLKDHYAGIFASQL